MVMQLDDDNGRGLPTAMASRKKMKRHVPKVRALLKETGAEDLSEVILGEDASDEEST